MALIEIPLSTSEEVLVVSPNDLKNDEKFLLDLLAEEKVGTGIYVKISVEYWKQGLYEQFERFLKAGREQSAKLPEEARECRAMICSMLGLYNIEVLEGLKLAAEGGLEKLGGYKTDDMERLEAEVKALVGEVTTICASMVTTYVLEGSYHMYKRELDEALAAYSKATAIDPMCTYSLIGEARVYFAKNDYVHSLEKYQAALGISGTIDMISRMHIGVCFYHLGMENLALMSFQRISILYPEQTATSLSIASIQMQIFRKSGFILSPAEQSSILEDINSRLSQALSLNPVPRTVKYLLSLLLLTREDFKSAYALAKSSLPLFSGKIAQQLTYVMARCLHHDAKYSEALELLESCLPLFKPASPAVEYLLAQLFLSNNFSSRALSLLESAVRSTNFSYFPTLRFISASLSNYSLSPSTFVPLLENFDTPDLSRTDLLPRNSAHILIEPYLLAKIASSLSLTDPGLSLKLYINAMLIMYKFKLPIPPSFYNNVGVLSFHLALPSISDVSSYSQPLPPQSTLLPPELLQITLPLEASNALAEIEALFMHSPFAKTYLIQAESCYIYSHFSARSSLSPNHFSFKLIDATAFYNSSILKKTIGMVNDSFAICQYLLKTYPTYVDNHLLLSQIYLHWLEFENSYHQLRTASSIDINSIFNRLLLANYHLQKSHDYLEAKRVYDSILRDISSNDAYTLCALGNLNIMFARTAKARDQKKSFLERAHRLFTTALSKNNSNISAAIGMGILLVEMDELPSAKLAFSQIQQLLPDNDNATVNLAQLLLLIDPHGSRMSIPLCQKALFAKNGSYNTYSLSLLAKSHYFVGKETKSYYDMKQSLKYTQISLLLSPSYSNFYNLALIKQHLLQIISEQPLETRTLAILESEVSKLNVAEKLFASLSQKKCGLKPKHLHLAKLRVSHCVNIRNHVLKKIQENAKLGDEWRERLEEIKKLQQRKQEEKTEQQQDELDRRSKEEEAIQKHRSEMQQRVLQDFEDIDKRELKRRRTEPKPPRRQKVRKGE